MKKNELINIEKESYEDYDFLEEDIDKIEQINPKDKIKKITILFCIIVSLLMVLIFGFKFITKQFELKNLKDQFEQNISSEELGQIEEPLEEVVTKTYKMGNLSGNLAQFKDFSDSSTSGLITYDDNFVYYLNKNKLCKMNLSDKSVEILYEEDNFSARNLNFNNNSAYMILNGYDAIGLKKNYICFYKLSSSNMLYFKNIMPSNIQSLTQVIPSLITNDNGLYYTLLNSDYIYYYDFLTKKPVALCQVKTSLMSYAKILNVTKECVWFLDESGVSVYDIENDKTKVISKIPQDVSYQPFIYNNKLIFKDSSSIYIDNKVIYKHNTKIESINAYNDKILFISNNILYSLDVNSLDVKKIYESTTYINEIYIVNDFVILDSNNINLIELK